MNSQDFRSLQEAYLDVYESETGRGPRLIDAYDKPPYSDDVKDAPKYKPFKKGPKMKGVIKKEEVDIYDIILSHLIDEGYAETPEAAEKIMVNMSEEWREEIMEGMTMKDFKEKRRRLQQKDKREDLKTSPTRRTGIHNPSASPERASRHRANVDPDFEGNDERNYPGGTTKSAKKVRKQKAVGEHDKW